MRQHGKARHIAGGIDARDAGPHLRIHLDAHGTAGSVHGQLYAHFFQADARETSPAAHGDQDAVTLGPAHLPFGGFVHHAIPLHGRHFAAQVELHALFGVLRLKHGADFLIHRAQDLGQHFHHRHLRADGIEEAGELHADDPAANHHQPLGLLRQGKDFPVGDNRSAKALPKPRNGRDNGLGARANKNLAGLIVLFSGRQLEGIGPLRHNRSGLPDHLHAGIPHLDADAAHKLFHHLVLALENGRNIYGSLRNGNAVFVGMARIIIYFRTV